MKLENMIQNNDEWEAEEEETQKGSRKGRCMILTSMPRPRKDGNCPFYKCMKERNKRDWEG